MTLFDYAVLVVVGSSVLLSVMRGLVREILSLAGWVVAFIAANAFSDALAGWLPESMGSPSVRVLVAFVLLFVTTLVLVALLARLARNLVHGAGLSTEDRVLGGLFGFARGMLLVMVFVLLAGLTNLPRHPLWNNAMLSAPLEALAAFVKPWLPQYLSQRITYD
jgi:membrane protein required for colicin V production